jgi:hypothetical protein
VTQRGFVGLVVVTGLWVGGLVGAAGAHFQSEDSVDGNEIRYEDYTKWDDSLSWSIARWQELSGGVKIAPDSWSTAADLEIGDYNTADGRCGYWDGKFGADVIGLNDRFFSGYSTTDRRACQLHEWGHAQRLDHSYDHQVMDDCAVSACGSAYTYPQSHDKSDYYSIW